ncbi:GMC family oxidoreductase N-terminal domain-containing protein [Methylogaea oryzae]|uniref:GMC family oxidoreductase N-terminal domain-containing protein n=1 Tax=Methylogaea oryzae TaxID=1295382 RepID=UPI0006D215FE|nr:GMC family oxidoreductase [Methylogaea oryzae]
MSPYENTAHAPYPDETRLDDYYVQKGPAKFRGIYMRVAGGTTWHFGGTATRMYPNDFRMRSAYGVGLDWPFEADVLSPWYERAERELGVAGDRGGSNGPERSSDFPLPEIPLTYSDRQIAAAAQPFGLTLGSHPQARNSVFYDDRPPCCGNGTCQPICPIQAKYDATVHLARAEAGGARVEVNAVVDRVVLDGERRVRRLEFLRPDGSRGEAVGSLYVVAAHAVETPKLLLMSRSELAPNGVANSSDQVGRNLMGHVQSGFFAWRGSRFIPAAALSKPAASRSSATARRGGNSPPSAPA